MTSWPDKAYAEQAGSQNPQNMQMISQQLINTDALYKVIFIKDTIQPSDIWKFANP